VFGELKRVGKGDESKRSREWTTEAIERLQTARGVTGRGRPYRTIEAALEAICEGVEVEGVEIDFASRHAGAEGAIGETLQVLLAEVKALRTEVAELSQTHAEIKNSGKVEDSAAVEATADRQHSLLVRLALKIDSWVRK
jgi:hypothetical protein